MNAKLPQELEEAFDLLVLFSRIEDREIPRTLVELKPGSPFLDFIRASPDNQRAWAACAKELQMLWSAEVRESSVNFSRIDEAIERFQNYVSRADVSPEVRRQLMRDLRRQRREYATLLKELEETKAGQGEVAARSAGPRPAGSPGVSPVEVAEDKRVARLVVDLRETFGKLLASARKTTDAEALLVQARAVLKKTLRERGLEPIYEYLAKLSDRQRPLIKQTATRVMKLEEAKAAAMAQGQMELANKIEERIEQAWAETDNLVRNKLKGVINELYTSKWAGWAAQRVKLLDEAVAVAERLPQPPGWDVIPVSGATSGPIRLDGLEIWDEAVLIVERLAAPGRPRAMLFAAAQLKAERDVSAIGQVIGDITKRERPGALLQFTDDKGGEQMFTLWKLPPDVEPQRWILNALGGKYSIAELQQAYSQWVNLQILSHDLSVKELNALSNAFLMSAAKTIP